jgi:hypothetical protein
MRRWIQSIAGLFPPAITGLVDYHLRPNLIHSWGGAFNGQCFRQLIFMDLLRNCHFDAIVETGTLRGSTTSFMATNAPIPVHSSELNRRNFGFASKHLQMFKNVRLVNQDSREFLRRLEFNKGLRTFFYLDAHWQNDLPLGEETEYIFSTFNRFVVMVDDFEVPGDPGYTFDDYGPGRKLSLSDFPFDRDGRVSVYFPNRPSDLESGKRRGCVVLASQELVPHVDRASSLLRIEPLRSSISSQARAIPAATHDLRSRAGSSS